MRPKTTERQRLNNKTLAEKRANMSNQYVPHECKRKFASKFDEYQYGEWKFNKPRVYVTVETIVPEVPQPLLEEPDDVEYHLAIVKLDELNEELNEQVTE